MKIQVEPLHIFRADPGAGLLRYARDVFRREAEDEPEPERGPGPADQIEAVASEGIPAGIFTRRLRTAALFDIVKEIPVDVSVNTEGVECNDLAFDETEAVKCIFQEKMRGSGFRIGHGKSDHISVPRVVCLSAAVMKTALHGTIIT